MARPITMCEEEFEKWYRKDGQMIRVMVMGIFEEANRSFARYVWNQAWKTCGEKMMEVVEKK